MSNTLNFTATVKSGSLIPEEVAKYLSEIQNYEGQEVSCSITQLDPKTRSSKQNRYYHGTIVYMIRQRLEDLGYVSGDLRMGVARIGGPLDTQETHEYLRDNFSREDVFNPNTGSVIGTRVRSTSDLTTKEFSRYIEDIVRWAAESLDLVIPVPKPTQKLTRYGQNKTTVDRDTRVVSDTNLPNAPF